MLVEVESNTLSLNVNMRKTLNDSNMYYLLAFRHCAGLDMPIIV